METIVITGGSDGLGKALTEKLSKDYNVVAIARNGEALKQIAELTQCDWYVCDVKDAKQVTDVMQKIANKYKTIDVVINNAGIIINGELVETSDKDIKNVIETNTLGSIYVAKSVLKYMKKQADGLIINVVSQSGLNARAGRSIYNASKWALTGFTKALQDEVAPYGVRVTGFYPGTLETKLFAKAGIDMKGPAITTSDAIAAIEFLISLNKSVLIPELGIKHVGRNSTVKTRTL